MAKKQGGGKLLPLPFTTFGEAAAHGFEASVRLVHPWVYLAAELLGSKSAA